MNKMKNLLLAAMCLIATSAVTSCLDSDDNSGNNVMTPEEESAYLGRLSGTYTGKMVFLHRGKTKYTNQDSTYRDSIMNTTWRMNRDSTIVIANFPDSIFNNAITGNSDLRNILKQAPSHTLTCHFAPYKYTYQNTTDYGFYVLPEGKANASGYMVTENKFTTGDKEYTAKYGYAYSLIYGNARLSADGYLSNTGKLEFILLAGSVECSGFAGSGYRTVPYQVLFSGVKMY